MKSNDEINIAIPINIWLNLYQFFKDETVSLPDGFDSITLEKKQLEAAINQLPSDKDVLRYLNTQRYGGKKSAVDARPVAGVIFSNLQDYREYRNFLTSLSNNDSRQHYEVLLNILINGSQSSPNPSRLFNLVMDVWLKKQPENANLYMLKPNVKEWMLVNIETKSEESAALISAYLDEIQQALAGSDVFINKDKYGRHFISDYVNIGLISLAGNAWVNNPLRLFAFVCYLLKQKKQTPTELKDVTATDILNSQLLQRFFLQNADNILDPSGVFQRFYQLISQHEETKSLYEAASKYPVGLELVFSSYSLTGQPNFISNTTSQGDIAQLPSLPYSLPTHDFNAYYKLFGLSYILELVNNMQLSRREELLVEALNNLDSSDLGYLLKQAPEENHEAFGSLLSNDSIKRLIEAKYWIIFSCVEREQLSFLQDKTDIERQAIIDSMIDDYSLDSCIGLMQIYTKELISLETTMKLKIYHVILRYRISNRWVISSDYLIDFFLGRFKIDNSSVIKLEIEFLNNTLNNLWNDVPASGLTQSDLYTMQDVWSLLSPQAYELTRLYRDFSVDFPKDKYDFHIWLMKKQLSKVENNINLSSMLTLIYGEDYIHNPEMKHQLFKFMYYIDNADLILQIVTILTEPPFMAQDLEYNGQNCLEMALKNQNIGLCRYLIENNKVTKQDWKDVYFKDIFFPKAFDISYLVSLNRNIIESLLLFFVKNNCTTMINKILALSGTNVPSQEALYKALEIALSYGEKYIANKLLALTDENIPIELAIGALTINLSAESGSTSIVCKMLKLTGENTPKELVVKALDVALRYDNVSILVRLLALTGESILTKQDINETLEFAAFNGQDDIVDKLLELTGINAPSQLSVNEALSKAVIFAHPSIVDKLLALTGINAPSQPGVDQALEAVAANASKYDLIITDKLLLLTGENAPSSLGVNRALEVAAKFGNKSTVDKLLALTGKNTPNQLGVNKALEVAAKFGNKLIIDTLLELDGVNAPSQECLDGILIHAAEMERGAILNKLVVLTGPNAPSKEAVNQAKKAALSKDNLAIVMELNFHLAKLYLCEKQQNNTGPLPRPGFFQQSAPSEISLIIKEINLSIIESVYTLNRRLCELGLTQLANEIEEQFSNPPSNSVSSKR